MRFKKPRKSRSYITPIEKEIRTTSRSLFDIKTGDTICTSCPAIEGQYLFHTHVFGKTDNERIGTSLFIIVKLDQPYPIKDIDGDEARDHLLEVYSINKDDRIRNLIPYLYSGTESEYAVIRTSISKPIVFKLCES